MYTAAPIDKKSHNKRAWIVNLTAALFFFYEFIQMNLFNSINVQLREAFHLDAVQLGQLFSMYFYANSLFLIPAGYLIDRFSTKKILLFALITCTTGAVMFALATDYWLAATGRFMEGIGASFCFLSCIRIASRWFPPARMAFVTGIIVTMAMLGGLMAQTPFELLIHFVGSWRLALLCNALLGILIAFAIFFVVQDRPSHAGEEAKTDALRLQELGLWRSFTLAALNLQNWYGGIYTALINLPVFILGGLWGMLYLTEVHHLTTVQSSYATTLFFVGVIFGSPAFGWLSDSIEKRVLPMAIGAVLSLLVILALMFIPNLSITSLMVLFFLIGFVTSSQVLTYPTIAELNPVYLTSTAVSIDSLCIMASGFIVPPFFGWLMERSGAHQMVNGVTVYASEAFHQAMWVIPISFAIALLITVWMRETNCRAQVL